MWNRTKVMKLIKKNQLIMLKFLTGMDARGNKLSLCQIPDQNRRNKKVIKLLELWLKKRKE